MVKSPPNMLAAALAYAQAGWPVFPCKPTPIKEEGSKAPYISQGFKSASKDPTIIKQWWAEWPHALVGAPMGRATNTFCVDLDRKPGHGDGVATWAELVAKHREHGEETPETRG